MPTTGSSGAVPRPNGASIADATSGTGSSPVPQDNPELRILADLVARRPGGIPVQDVLRSVLIAMSEALDASSAVLVLTAGECGDELDPVVRSGRFERLGEPCLDSVESFIGLAARTDGLVRSGDLSRDDRAAEAERRIGAGPACGRRLVAGEGVVGAVGFARDRGGEAFTEADEAALEEFDRVFAALASSLGLVRPRDGDPPSPAERRLMNTLRHEVNNPLAVVMGQAQILRNDPGIDADPHLKQSIEAIWEGSERIRDVLRALTAAGESKGRPREG
jgi:hypothetical protein